MAKAASTATIAKVDAEAQVIEVRVVHAPAASYSRSVKPAAWKVAVEAATAAKFTNRHASADYALGVDSEGSLCVSVITYRFTAN